ncbi:Riboflavin kinase [Dirofilaria immitis]
MSFTGAVHLSKCNAGVLRTAKAWPIDTFELIRRFLAKGVRKVTTGITNCKFLLQLMPYYMVLLFNRMIKWLPKPGTMSERKITCRRLDYWSRCCKQ